MMGSPENTAEVVLSVAELADVAPTPQLPTGFRAGRMRVRSWVKRYFSLVDAGPGEAALASACSQFGLASESLRKRVGELDAVESAKLRLAVAWASGRRWMTFIDPFEKVPGHVRTGLRSTFADLIASSDRGAVFTSSILADFIIAEAGVANIEKGELVALGSLQTIVSEPRGSLPAELSRVNIYSGLARKGWLSIGHSAVRARTELDGKVFVTLSWRSAQLSLDEHDPAFTGPTVFEAIVVGLRDQGTCIQAKLSPVDTEMGLPLDVDLVDLAGVTDLPQVATASAGSEPLVATASAGSESAAEPRGFGILHPGLGASIAELRRNVRVGTHVFVEVDTSALNAYSIE